MSTEETDKKIAVLFKALLKEYCNLNRHVAPEDNDDDEVETTLTSVDFDVEKQTINEFLNRSYGCGCNCQKLFTKEAVKSFIINFAAAQGLPDPGRDVRKGNGRLQILLPFIIFACSWAKPRTCLFIRCLILEA